MVSLMNENAAWLHLSYLTEYGRPIQHTASINGIRAVRELLNRYRINEEHILSCTIDGVPYDLMKGNDDENS